MDSYGETAYYGRSNNALTKIPVLPRNKTMGKKVKAMLVEPSVIMSLATPLKRYMAYLGHDIDEPKQSALPFVFFVFEMLNNRKSG